METKFKTIDNNEFKKLLAKIKRQTAYNNHSEALMSIADFFGYEEYYKLFRDYSERDGLSIEEYYAICAAKDRMFIIIQAEYGADVIKRIDEVL